MVDEPYYNKLTYFDTKLKSNPKEATAWNNKGLLLLHLLKFEEAIACFDKAIELRPNYIEAWNNKGLAYLENKYYENNAIDCFDKAAEVYEENASVGVHDLWNNLGVSYYAARDYNRAIDCFDNKVIALQKIEKKRKSVHS